MPGGKSGTKGWAEKVLASCPIPLVTCEAVLTEACLVHLVATYRSGMARVVTVDRKDFSMYCTRSGQPMACLFPEDEEADS